EAVHLSNLPAAHLAHWAVLIGVFVTSFYSFRLYFLVFHGKERFDQNPDNNHHSHGHHAGGKPHETPWVVTVPLILLAIPSVIIGYMTIEPMLLGGILKDAIYVNSELHPAVASFVAEFHGPMAMALHGLSTPPFWLALAGALSAWYMYLIKPALPAAIARALKPVMTVLENKYYLDWINENVIARGVRALGTGLWKGGDRGVIEGGVVNASWKLVDAVSSVVRRAQSGYLYHYALVMI